MAVLWVGWATMITAQGGAAVDNEEGASPPPELTNKAYLFDVVQYLYRWYLDESDAEKVIGEPAVRFLVRRLPAVLDAGDRSQLAEIRLPQLGVQVLVKKADYRIEELDLEVRNDRFKIINVARETYAPATAEGFVEVPIGRDELYAHQFRTRREVRFPEGDLLMRMRRAARQEIEPYLHGRGDPIAKGDQVVHLAPMSPVANDLWCFWEAGRLLVRFASDIDLENPALWEHDELSVQLFNVDEQTVVSLDEVAGSNAYLTRDFVGRVLFNCVVLGRRLVLEPL